MYTQTRKALGGLVRQVYGVKSVNVSDTLDTYDIRLQFAWWVTRARRERIRTAFMYEAFDSLGGSLVVTCL